MATESMNQPALVRVHWGDVQFIDWDKIVEGLMVDLEKRAQLHRQNIFRAGDEAMYYRECRTLGANAGRQSGRSRWLSKRVVSDDYLVFQPATVMCHHFLQAVCADRLEKDPEGLLPTVITYPHLRTHPPQRTFKEIIVDDASLFFRKVDIVKFYKVCMPLCRPETLFLLMG